MAGYPDFGRVSVETQDYTCDLAQAHDYTGFTIFYEGYDTLGRPAGLWDELLGEYCRGVREKPVWAIGGLGFDSAGDLRDAMKGLRNVLLVHSLSKTEALEALREGRLYVINGNNSSEFILDKFIVRDNASGIEATMGQAVALQGSPQLEIKGRLRSSEGQSFSIKLIRDGKIIETFEARTPFDIIYQDTSGLNETKTYYRIEAESGGILLVTNPIFVTLSRN